MTMYQCLNCGTPFKNYTNSGKFHVRACYTEYRKTHTDAEIKKTPAIVLSGKLEKIEPIPDEKTPSQPDVIPEPTTTEELLNFDSMTISEIKTEFVRLQKSYQSDNDVKEIKDLIHKVVEILTLIQNTQVREPPRRDALHKNIPLRTCAYCGTSFKPLCETEIFCCDDCAQSRLSETKTGVLIRPDFTLLSAGRS